MNEHNKQKTAIWKSMNSIRLFLENHKMKPKYVVWTFVIIINSQFKRNPSDI